MTMNIPDQISSAYLKELGDKAKDPGLTVLDSADLIAQAKQTINDLEKIITQLDGTRSTNVLGERWSHFVQARRSIKIAVRNMKKAIRV